MTTRFMECFKHLSEDEESAAECIHCLRKYGEQVMFDDKLGRLKLGRELYEDHSKEMTKLTEILKIKTRAEYEEADKKFNLTMY
jgi:hypothetical protein